MPTAQFVQTQALATLARLVEIKRLEPKMEDLGTSPPLIIDMTLLLLFSTRPGSA